MENHSTGLEKFRPIDAELTKAAESLATVVVSGPDDKKGYSALSAGISQLTKFRTTIEKARIELKRPLLEMGRRIDAESKRLLEITAATETRLRNQRDEVDNQRRQAKEAAERAALERFRNRTDALFAAGFVFNGYDYQATTLLVSARDVELQDDDWFADILNVGKSRLAEAAEIRRINDERLAELEAATQVKILAADEAERQEADNRVVFLDADGSGPIAGYPLPVSEALEIVERFEPTPDLRKILERAKALPTPRGLFGHFPGIGTDVQFSPFQTGFELCRQKVIAILSSPDKFTRDELRQKITDLTAP